MVRTLAKYVRGVGLGPFNSVFFLVTIAFKPMASAHDGYSYHQAKTLIGFWYRWDLNPDLLLDDKRLYQLS